MSGNAPGDSPGRHEVRRAFAATRENILETLKAEEERLIRSDPHISEANRMKKQLEDFTDDYTTKVAGISDVAP